MGILRTPPAFSMNKKASDNFFSTFAFKQGVAKISIF
jgi:hypothetical protein